MHPVQEQLVRALSRMPGIGKRSAERIAQRLITDRGGAQRLIEALEVADEQLLPCRQCGYITDRGRNPCSICSSVERDRSVLCLVESPADVDLVESSGGHGGRYFCLLGKISPMSGEDLPDERVGRLLAWIEHDGIQEVILALNADVESDATAVYLSRVLQGAGVKVSRLAMGIPAGSGLAYSDPVTLSRALKNRQNY